MKRILFAITLSVPFLLSAQTEGTVRYQETVLLNIEMPDMDEEMLARIPKSTSVQKLLHFSATESLYMDEPQDEFAAGDMNWTGSSAGGGEVKMVMRRPESRFYMDLDAGERIEQREFFGKVFLVKDALPQYGWKLTGEQKTILDYACQQATFADSTRKLVAWFTPEIPVSTGPDAFGQLPGLVLEVDVNDGERVITATAVKLAELEKGSIEKPAKGKEVNQEEFQAIVKEKMTEMEAEYGPSSGGSGMKIIIRN